jgi:hypothetical protein
MQAMMQLIMLVQAMMQTTCDGDVHNNSNMGNFQLSHLNIYGRIIHSRFIHTHEVGHLYGA